MTPPENSKTSSIPQYSEASDSKSCGQEMFVSVIIPVFNDQERLKLCLAALEHQTYPQHCYEVIVVDNASEQDIQAVVEQFSQAKLAFEPQAGSYVARNRGILEAQGEILAFTDADCIPDVQWVEKGVAKLLSVPNCGLVGGRIELFCQNPELPTPVELFEKIELNFFQDEKLQKDHFAMTANIFTFKTVFETVGLFNSALKSGGDREWGQRVYAAGYQQLYADDAFVSHPARHLFSQLRKRITRLVGGSFDRFMNQNPSPIDIVQDLLGTFRPPFRSLYRAWTNEQLANSRQKLQFIGVMFFARYIVISEKIRLYLGGSAQRG